MPCINDGADKKGGAVLDGASPSGEPHVLIPGDVDSSGSMAAQQFIARSLKFSQGFALTAILVGAMVLFGWMLDSALLTSILPHAATMKPNTALCFLLSGLVLLLHMRQVSWLSCSAQVWFRRLGAATVLLIASLTLAEYGLGFDAHIDVLMFSSRFESHYADRMSVATAFGFCFLGLALVLLPVAWRRIRPAQLCSLATILVAIVGLQVYLFDARALGGVFAYSSMAVHTSVLFLLLGSAVLLAQPDRGLMIVLSSAYSGGRMMRRLLPFVLSLPLIVAWISWQGNLVGIYPMAFGLTMRTTANLLIVTVLIWWVARILNQEDAVRQRVEAQSRRLAAIVASSEDAMIGKDLNGRVTSWNKGAEKIFGYLSEEMVGMSITQLMPADRMDEEPRILSEIARGESIRHFETQRVRKDGRVIDVSVVISPIKDERGYVIGASKVARDITEHKNAERKIANSLRHIQQLKLALDEHAIVAMTDRRGDITYVNDKFCAISKYSEEELIGQNHRLVNSGYHPKSFFQNLWQTIAAGKVWKGEIKNRAKDGSFYWVQTTIVPFLDEHGKPHQYVALCNDITENKHINEELLQLAEELTRSNKDLEQFAYVASHDLQEPLRAVAGCVELLRQRYQGKIDERADEFISHAVDGASRMQRLIDDLLMFSRVGTRAQALMPCDSGKALENALSNLEVAIQESGVVITHDEMPVVRSDVVQLTLLFQNLIGNAIKFRNQEAAKIHVSAQRQDDEWVLSVNDNGIGIDPQYFERIFGVFQRLHTRTEYPGTGIGLAICKKIVERQGGRLWLVSTPGVGSTFSFSLKACDMAELTV